MAGPAPPGTWFVKKGEGRWARDQRRFFVHNSAARCLEYFAHGGAGGPSDKKGDVAISSMTEAVAVGPRLLRISTDGSRVYELTAEEDGVAAAWAAFLRACIAGGDTPAPAAAPASASASATTTTTSSSTTSSAAPAPAGVTRTLSSGSATGSRPGTPSSATGAWFTKKAKVGRDQKRWFVLQGSTVAYYANEKSGSGVDLKGEIELVPGTKVSASGTQLTLALPSRTFVLVAASVPQAARWVGLLKDAVPAAAAGTGSRRSSTSSSPAPAQPSSEEGKETGTVEPKSEPVKGAGGDEEMDDKEEEPAATQATPAPAPATAAQPSDEDTDNGSRGDDSHGDRLTSLNGLTDFQKRLALRTASNVSQLSTKSNTFHEPTELESPSKNVAVAKAQRNSGPKDEENKDAEEEEEEEDEEPREDDDADTVEDGPPPGDSELEVPVYPARGGVWLKKKGEGIGPLRRRYFVLVMGMKSRDLRFKYYADLDGSTPTKLKGQIPISLETAIAVEPHGNHLLLDNPDRQWRLTAENEETAHEWATLLREALAKAARGSTYEPSPSPPASPEKIPAAAAPAATASTAAAAAAGSSSSPTSAPPAASADEDEGDAADTKPGDGEAVAEAATETSVSANADEPAASSSTPAPAAKPAPTATPATHLSPPTTRAERSGSHSSVGSDDAFSRAAGDMETQLPLLSTGVWLDKRGEGLGFLRWRERYFWLTKGADTGASRFSYYTDAERTDLKGSIRLTAESQIELDDKHINIENGDRKWHMRAESEAVAARWARYLRNVSAGRGPEQDTDSVTVISGGSKPSLASLAKPVAAGSDEPAQEPAQSMEIDAEHHQPTPDDATSVATASELESLAPADVRALDLTRGVVLGKRGEGIGALSYKKRLFVLDPSASVDADGPFLRLNYYADFDDPANPRDHKGYIPIHPSSKLGSIGEAVSVGNKDRTWQLKAPNAAAAERVAALLKEAQSKLAVPAAANKPPVAADDNNKNTNVDTSDNSLTVISTRTGTGNDNDINIDAAAAPSDNNRQASPATRRQVRFSSDTRDENTTQQSSRDGGDGEEIAPAAAARKVSDVSIEVVDSDGSDDEGQVFGEAALDNAGDRRRSSSMLSAVSDMTSVVSFNTEVDERDAEVLEEYGLVPFDPAEAVGIFQGDCTWMFGIFFEPRGRQLSLHFFTRARGGGHGQQIGKLTLPPFTRCSAHDREVELNMMDRKWRFEASTAHEARDFVQAVSGFQAELTRADTLEGRNTTPLLMRMRQLLEEQATAPAESSQTDALVKLRSEYSASVYSEYESQVKSMLAARSKSGSAAAGADSANKASGPSAWFVKKAERRGRDQRRFFQLIGDKLYYFVDNLDGKQRGFISLSPQSKITLTGMQLRIDNPDRPWFLVAESLTQAEEWLDHLTAAAHGRAAEAADAPLPTKEELSATALGPENGDGAAVCLTPSKFQVLRAVDLEVDLFPGRGVSLRKRGESARSGDRKRYFKMAFSWSEGKCIFNYYGRFLEGEPRDLKGHIPLDRQSVVLVQDQQLLVRNPTRTWYMTATNSTDAKLWCDFIKRTLSWLNPVLSASEAPSYVPVDVRVHQLFLQPRVPPLAEMEVQLDREYRSVPDVNMQLIRDMLARAQQVFALGLGHEEVVVAGGVWLVKQPHKTGSAKRRFFKLRGTDFEYYADEDNGAGVDQKGRIAILPSTIITSCQREGEDRAQSILVQNPDRPWVLSAESAEEQQMWIEYLRQAQIMAFGTQPHLTSVVSTGSSADEGGSGTLTAKQMKSLGISELAATPQTAATGSTEEEIEVFPNRGIWLSHSYGANKRSSAASSDQYFVLVWGTASRTLRFKFYGAVKEGEARNLKGSIAITPDSEISVYNCQLLLSTGDERWQLLAGSEDEAQSWASILIQATEELRVLRERQENPLLVTANQIIRAQSGTEPDEVIDFDNLKAKLVEQYGEAAFAPYEMLVRHALRDFTWQLKNVDAATNKPAFHGAWFIKKAEKVGRSQKRWFVLDYFDAKLRYYTGKDASTGQGTELKGTIDLSPEMSVSSSNTDVILHTDGGRTWELTAAGDEALEQAQRWEQLLAEACEAAFPPRTRVCQRKASMVNMELDEEDEIDMFPGDGCWLLKRGAGVGALRADKNRYFTMVYGKRSGSIKLAYFARVQSHHPAGRKGSIYIAAHTKTSCWGQQVIIQAPERAYHLTAETAAIARLWSERIDRAIFELNDRSGGSKGARPMPVLARVQQLLEPEDSDSVNDEALHSLLSTEYNAEVLARLQPDIEAVLASFRRHGRRKSTLSTRRDEEEHDLFPGGQGVWMECNESIGKTRRYFTLVYGVTTHETRFCGFESLDQGAPEHKTSSIPINSDTIVFVDDSQMQLTSRDPRANKKWQLIAGSHEVAARWTNILSMAVKDSADQRVPLLVRLRELTEMDQWAKEDARAKVAGQGVKAAEAAAAAATPEPPKLEDVINTLTESHGARAVAFFEKEIKAAVDRANLSRKVPELPGAFFQKKSGTLLGKARKRFFELRGNQIKYYAAVVNGRGVRPKGTIGIYPFTQVQSEGKELVIENLKSRTWRLVGESSQTAARWAKAIRMVIDNFEEHMDGYTSMLADADAEAAEHLVGEDRQAWFMKSEEGNKLSKRLIVLRNTKLTAFESIDDDGNPCGLRGELFVKATTAISFGDTKLMLVNPEAHWELFSSEAAQAHEWAAELRRRRNCRIQVVDHDEEEGEEEEEEEDGADGHASSSEDSSSDEETADGGELAAGGGSAETGEIIQAQVVAPPAPREREREVAATSLSLIGDALVAGMLSVAGDACEQPISQRANPAAASAEGEGEGEGEGETRAERRRRRKAEGKRCACCCIS